MKKEKWIINGTFLIDANFEEVTNWCTIQNKINEYYHAKLNNESIEIFAKKSSKLTIKRKKK